MPVFLRAVTGLLVFLGVLCSPLHFTLSGHLVDDRKTPGSIQLADQNQSTPPPLTPTPQPVEKVSPPAAERNESPQLPPEVLTPLRESQAAQPPLIENTQIIKRVDTKGQVGITFDDGPIAGMTELYLQVLEKHDTRATFFMLGQQVSTYPELAQKVINQGSEIGSHSWRHSRLDQLEQVEVVTDLQNVAQQVYDTVGQEISLLRPPYGRHSETVVTAARELSQQVIMWDVDPRDWEDPAPQQIVNSIMDQVKPGSIIILHEGHQNTLLALPEIIQKLRERDLEPVPVSKLLAGSGS